MVRDPDTVTAGALDAAPAAARKKGKDGPLDSVHLTTFSEGECLQCLHIGPYTDEAPGLARLHDEVMPAAGLTFAGPRHEIHLSDPRRTQPEKLKTILRQPVRPVGPVT